VDAARWLRDNSDADDLVATNRHCVAVAADPCDSRRFVVAGATERQVLVEGWAYTPTWDRSPTVDGHPAYKPFWDPELLATNDRAFSAPSPERFDGLRALGVDWLFVDKTAPHDPDIAQMPGAVLETEWAIVLDLRHDDR
jgi:hypothetical protein